MAVTINASTTAGLVNTADTSGVLALQTAGTTAVTVNASQVVSIGTTNVGGTLNTTTTSGNWGVLIYDGTNNASMLQFRNNAGAAAGDISLSSAGATSLLISSVAGVNFPATQVASANANTLDDYEEGTFSPTITASSGSVTYAANGQVGTYVKVGGWVFIQIFVGFSKNTISGNLNMANLPFTSKSGTAYYSTSCGYWNNLATAVVSLTSFMDSNTTQFAIRKLTAAATSTNPSLTDADVGASGNELMFSVFYPVN